MKTSKKWLFVLVLFGAMEAFGQEVDNRVKVLLPPGQPEAGPKKGNEIGTNAKIEASKGTNTLPPGLNTTQMVAEQYRNSGALKPYKPMAGNASPASSGAVVGMVATGGTQTGSNNSTQKSPAMVPPGNKNLKSGGSSLAGVNPVGMEKGKLPVNKSSNAPVYGSLQKIPAPGYEQPGAPFGKTSENSLKVKSASTSNHYESVNAHLSASGRGNMPAPNAGVSKTVIPGNPAANTYDKVPYLLPPSAPGNNVYGPPPVTGAQGAKSNYGTLPLSPPGSAGNNTYGPPPVTGAQGAKSSYGTLPLSPTGSAGNNIYGPPPVTGAQGAKSSYGTVPSSQPGSTGNNVYGPPPVTGPQSSNGNYGTLKLTQPNSNNTYGPPPVTGNQGSNSSYGTLPLSPPGSAGNNVYGPPPVTGPQSSNGNYGTLKLTQPSSNNTYGPPPVTGNQGSKSSYGTLPLSPPATSGNNTYGPPPQALKNASNNTYGPPPNSGNQNNTYHAPPVTGNQSSKNYSAPPQTGTKTGAAPTQMYGPLPAPSTSGGQSSQALPANNGGYTKAPPPATGSQSAGTVPASNAPGTNPKVLQRTDKGGAIKVPPKSNAPIKR